jgi:hypothetical protein
MAIKFAIAFCLTYKKQWHIFGLLMLQKLLQVVLNFRTFHFCTTCIFVYYKFSAQIHLLYAELKLSHIADERTFQAITQWQCKLSPKLCFVSTKCQKGQSRWPRGLRHGSVVAHLLGLQVWIMPGTCILSLVSVVRCQIKLSATGWSLIQKHATECGVCKAGIT